MDKQKYQASEKSFKSQMWSGQEDTGEAQGEQLSPLHQQSGKRRSPRLKSERPRLRLRHRTQDVLKFTPSEASGVLQHALGRGGQGQPFDLHGTGRDQQPKLRFERSGFADISLRHPPGGQDRKPPRRRRHLQTRLRFAQAETLRELQSRFEANRISSSASGKEPGLRTEPSHVLRDQTETMGGRNASAAHQAGHGQNPRLRFERSVLRDAPPSRDGQGSSHGAYRRRYRYAEKSAPDESQAECPKSGLKFEEDRQQTRKSRFRIIGQTIVQEVEKEFRRIAEQSENEAVQAANKEREIVFKGLSEGGRFGVRWREGHSERVSQREIRQQNKELIRQTQERAYELRHGKPSPAAARRKQQMVKRQQLRAKAEQKLGRETVQKTEQIIAIVAEKAMAVIRAIVAYVGAPILGMILLCALIIMMIMMMFSAMTNNATVVLSSYTASDADIERSSVYMTELEAKLDKEIKDIPTDWRWRHIDEFRYDLDPIGHDPFQLMAYLNVKYPGFENYAEVTREIDYIFDQRYELILDEEWEWRGTRPDRYKYYILNVTLRVKPLEPLLLRELRANPTPDLEEWYGVLMETEGARQSYANPFGLDWKDRVTSLYGYRVDPVGSVNLQMHRGLDIAMPKGTPIRAGLSGTVRYVGEDDQLGLYIILHDPEADRTIKYAHCDSIAPDAGEEVVAGETVIGRVGSTGNSTGDHVHIEIQEKGAYLNPIYALTSQTGGETD